MFDKLKAKLWLMSVSKKKDTESFWRLSLNNLSGKQINIILKIIDDELVESFNFGLKISHKHVFKEKAAVLMVLNTMGNLYTMPQRFSFDEAREFFFKSIYQILEEENKFYFEESKKKGGVLTKYNCHIESVASSLLREIYNGKTI